MIKEFKNVLRKELENDLLRFKRDNPRTYKLEISSTNCQEDRGTGTKARELDFGRVQTRRYALEKK